MESSAAYIAMLQSIYPRGTGRFTLGLERMRDLLGRLEHPEHHSKTIVVAGTNGKGSTSRFLEAALLEHGDSVGLFTSPHLLRFTERIRVNGEEITQDHAVSHYESIKLACNELPTFFECITAIAFLEFKRANTKWRIMEVGLGGRLDATNVAQKCLTVITPIDLDHQMYLGHSIEEIAQEKAGILEKGIPVVIAQQNVQARSVIENRAQDLACPIIDASCTRICATALVNKHQLAAYQIDNLATAMAAYQTLTGDADETSNATMDRALHRYLNPGRYQWIDDRTLLDGAHNPAGAHALIDALAQDPRAQNRPISLILSSLHDKDIGEILRPWKTRAHEIHLCPCTSGRSRTSEELAKTAYKLGIKAKIHPSLHAALETTKHSPNNLVVITGSLFLVADALALLCGIARDPPVDG